MIWILLLLLVALSALHPLFSVLAAVFFGFFVPGFAIVKRLKIEGEGVFIIALSIAVSILVSTHAVYFVSLAIGYGTASILISFAAFALLSHGIEWKMPKLDPLPMAAALCFFVLMFSLFVTTLWVPTENGVIVGGWNWSDLFAHLPIIQSVNHGNFPPQTPFFAGFPLNYHWFVDFHTAILSKLTTVPPTDWIRFENALYNGLLVLAAWALASRFLKKKYAVTLAVAFFLFSGSFAYLNFFSDFAKNPTLELIKQNPYDNDWKFFQVPSLIGGFLIVQRPQMIGLPVLALALCLLVDGFPRKKRNALLAGLMVSLLVPFQYFAFGAALGLGLILIAHRAFEEKKIHIQATAAFLAPLILAVPFVLSAFNVGQSAGFLRFSPGWLAPKDPIGFVMFYAGNFGLVLLLALAGLALSKVHEKRLLCIWALALFLLPNLVTLSGTQWDMSKFFAYMMLPLGILAAAWISERRKAIQAVALTFSALTPVLLLAWTFQSTWIGLTTSELAAGAWIEKNTPELSVIAAFPSHNSPVDAVAGRLRLSGYNGWMANYGLPHVEREQALNRIYCSPPRDSYAQAHQLNVKYVYAGDQERTKYPCPHPFESAPEFFQKKYDTGGIQIYQVIEAPAKS